MPLSRCNNIVMKDIQVETPIMLDVKTSDKQQLPVNSHSKPMPPRFLPVQLGVNWEPAGS